MARDINDWGDIEFNLFQEMAGLNTAMENDRYIQAVYDTALFNWDISASDRSATLGALRDHMWNEYGVDFDDVFDWEGYRASYDSSEI